MNNPFLEERFAPLRNMEQFTDAMFNRIVAFQERQHPAWDEQAPFSERIRNLPLHYLIFSNADRDPTRYAHTVAPFYPIRAEIRTIAACIRQVAAQPVVCDFQCRNGFVGSLLAREGVRVTGVRDGTVKPNQIENFYDRDLYELREGPLDQIDFPFDVAFNAWMPAGVNLTETILRYEPKMIVLIYTDHLDPQGRRQTGTDEAFTRWPDRYRVVAQWSLTRPENLLHEIWPDLTPSIEEERHVRILADTPYHDIDVSGWPDAPPYDWEEELEMALLGLEAKEALRARGMKL